MAKQKSARKKKRVGEAVKIVALLVFIFIGLGVIAGSIWYNGYHLPEGRKQITAAAIGFAQEYFNTEYESITGREGEAFMTERLAEKVLASGRVDTWREQKLATLIEGEIEASIISQKLRASVARIVFWRQELVGEDSGKRSLVYYDLDLVRSGGRWQIDEVRVADPEELRALRQSRGADEQLETR